MKRRQISEREREADLASPVARSACLTANRFRNLHQVAVLDD